MKHMRKIVAAALALVLAGSLLAGCGGSDASKDAGAPSVEGVAASELHIAIQPSAAFIPLYIAREKGWIEAACAEYGVTVVWNDFESGPPMNESLASGNSDIGVIGDVPTVSAIAAGQENEVIAIAAQAADSYAVLVAADSDIATAADLAGKKVATVVGSTGHNLTQKFLATAGLDVNDIELVNIGAGDAATVLANHEVDAVAIWEPTVTRLVDNGTAKIVAEGSDCGLAGTNTIVARKAFTEASPVLTGVVLEQYARAAAAIDTLDDETWEKVAADLSLEPEQVRAILPKYDFSVKIAQEDVDALNDTIAFLVGIDAIAEAYDIADYMNGSYYQG